MTEHGGAREGAGRKKGGMNEARKEALAIKTAYEDRIRKHADKLFNAQFTLATGTQMLFVIHTDSKGVRRKPEMVTDPDIIMRFLDENKGEDGNMEVENYEDNSKCEDYFFLTTQRPDGKALNDLLDRAFGKAPATLDLTSGGERIRTAPIIVSDIGGAVIKADEEEQTEEEG